MADRIHNNLDMISIMCSDFLVAKSQMWHKEKEEKYKEIKFISFTSDFVVFKKNLIRKD